MQFFNVLEKNCYRDRAAAAMTFSKTRRHRHGVCGAAAVAAAPPWTSLQQFKQFLIYRHIDLQI
jgi:hypothetical protein